MKLLMIDNYDSFTHTIVGYCAELGATPEVVRNDRITLDEIAARAPDVLLISPGPGTPAEAGVSLDAVRRFSGRIPILGVCLGHQCIGAAFGGEVGRAAEPMHGRAAPILHDGEGVFAGLPQGIRVGRYHSLIVRPNAEMEQALKVTARTEAGEVMALAHRRHPTVGVQFHPESILSEHGHRMIGNFFDLAKRAGHALVA